MTTPSPPAHVTVKMDFNWKKNGRYRAFVEDADGPVQLGQVVRLLDEDGTEGHGRVEALDGQTMLLDLVSEWIAAN